jgi:hypothetical protein
MAESSGSSRAPDDRTYLRLADLAEGLVDEIACSVPDWCRLVREAGELARTARPYCSRVRRNSDVPREGGRLPESR